MKSRSHHFEETRCTHAARGVTSRDGQAIFHYYWYPIPPIFMEGIGHCYWYPIPSIFTQGVPSSLERLACLDTTFRFSHLERLPPSDTLVEPPSGQHRTIQWACCPLDGSNASMLVFPAMEACIQQAWSALDEDGSYCISMIVSQRGTALS